MRPAPAARMRLLYLLLAAGCGGVIEGAAPERPGPEGAAPGALPGPAPTDGAGPVAGAGPPAAAPPFSCTPGSIDPGPSPLLRLTLEQYLNTVRDAFGSIPDLRAVFPPEERSSSLGLVQPDVSQVELEHFQTAAELVARTIAGSPTRLNAAAPCDGADTRACARTFLQRLGTRLYRAPLEAAEVERHLALYDLGVRAGGHARGMEVLLRGMLQAPRFLYRVELGTAERVGPNAVKLSGWEIAARLSYAVWNTAPDSRLLEAAARGDLATPAGRAAQIARMLQDPRGARWVRGFLEEWTQLAHLDDATKDRKMFPEWGAPLRSAMRAQARALFDHVLARHEGRLDVLLTSTTVFVPPALADFYGVPPAEGIASLERADGSAAGLLTLPAILATQAKPEESWPIYRGKFVREELFCQPLPSPPDDADVELPDVRPGQSRRDRLIQHATAPACSGCHRLIDPIGFAFETYDAIGRHRTTEGGRRIDTAGELVGTDVDGRFADVPALARRMAGSPQVQACVARQWFRHALGRFEQEADGCSMKAIYDAFRGARLGLGALAAATLQSDAFLHRRPLPEAAR